VIDRSTIWALRNMPALEYICFRGRDITIRKGYKHLTTALLAESGFNKCPESENFKICLRTSGSSSIITTYRRESPQNYLDKQKPLLEAVVLESAPFNVIFGFNYHKDDEKDSSWPKGKALMEDSPHVKFVNPNPSKSFSEEEESDNLAMDDFSLVDGAILQIEVDSDWKVVFSEEVMKLFLKTTMLLFPMKVETLDEILSHRWSFLRDDYQINLVPFGRYHRVSLYAQKAKHFLPPPVGSDKQGIIISVPEDQVSVKKTWLEAESYLKMHKQAADIEVIGRALKRFRRSHRQDNPEGTDVGVVLDANHVLVVEDGGAAPLPSDQGGDHHHIDLFEVFDDEESLDFDVNEDQSGDNRDHEEGGNTADKRGVKRGHEESESRPKKKFRESTKRTHLDLLEESKIRASDMPPIVYEGVEQMTLILGMVYSLSEDPQVFGQEYRDQVRCKELEKLAFVVETVDDKHSPDCAGRLISLSFETNHFTVRDKHVQVRITSMRDFGSALFAKYQFNALFRYDHIMIDYFFAPGGEYQTTWAPFVEKVVPELHNTILAKGGSIWIPAWPTLLQSILDKNLEELYDIYYVPPEKHPLYIATEKAEKIVQTTLKRSFTNSQEAPPSFMRMIPKYQNGQSFLSLDSALHQLGRHVRTHHMPEGHRQALGRAKSILPEQDNHVKDAKQLILESPELIGYEVGFTGEWVILEGGRICLNLTGDSPSNSTPKGSEASASSIGSGEEEIPSL
jgi:hypothetical protein